MAMKTTAKISNLDYLSCNIIDLWKNNVCCDQFKVTKKFGPAFTEYNHNSLAATSFLMLQVILTAVRLVILMIHVMTVKAIEFCHHYIISIRSIQFLLAVNVALYHEIFVAHKNMARAISI